MTATPTAEHLDWRTIFTVAADAPDKTITALDAYFEPFAQPVFDGEDGMSERPMRCLNCGKALTGFFASMFGGGGWEWGIAHGEGRCASCGWPGRAMHYINHADGTEVVSIRNLVLQYHPDVVSTAQQILGRGRVMHTTRYMIDDGSDRPYDGEFFTREKLIDLQSPLRGVMSGHRTHSKGTEK